MYRSGQIDAKELQRALVNGNWSNFSEEACRLMIGESAFALANSISSQKFLKVVIYEVCPITK
jgi:hypothetical protein